jgi:hypothetical protein
MKGARSPNAPTRKREGRCADLGEEPGEAGAGEASVAEHQRLQRPQKLQRRKGLDVGELAVAVRPVQRHSPPTRSLARGLRHPTNPNAPLPGDGNLAPAYVPPTWYVLLAHAQYTNIGPPITPPGALPTLTASTHQLSRKNLRRGSRATTEEEDSENLLGHL